MRNDGPAPVPGQDDNTFPARPSQVLVNKRSTATVINVPTAEPTALDVRVRGRTVRYTNDPNSGIWRGTGGAEREQVSPFAIVRIEIGRNAYAITVRLPRTGDQRVIEGDADRIADALHQAGARIGFRGDRQRVFWALTEIVNYARRQAAARGAAE